MYPLNTKDPLFKTIVHGCETIRSQADDAEAYREIGDLDLSLEVLANMLSDAETLQRQIQRAIDECGSDPTNVKPLKCDQCGASLAVWQEHSDRRCPNHANPHGSCDGILRAEG
jgi:hypothetical protein